jgi:hypothetical protein
MKKPGSAKERRQGSRMSGIQAGLGCIDVETASSRVVGGRNNATAPMEGLKLEREQR